MLRKQPSKDKTNKEIKKNLPVRLPIELHKKLKIYAAKQGKTMVEIVIEQIEKLPLK
ncbi:MAG: toxin-antitoxin system HicB family antitoxin [Gammaproteobacteria bacterium]|nr:MAG: toxin-antitoxin system HicB family antitoxin [Gammaproteobacteria bacterium]